MAEGRSRAAWNHTASIMALLANINRDPRRRSQPYKPEEFTPHASRNIAPVPVKQVDMKSLKNMYLGMGIPVRTVKAEDIKVRKRADG
jgi:hypothetical protein